MRVHEVLGLTLEQAKKGAQLGIECETEGRNLPMLDNRFWRTEQDGSLRNGLEYVSHPLKPEALRPAFTALNTGFRANEAVLDYSFRCSTHVHVNVQDFNENQLKSMIFLYMMYENVFMNYVAPHRVGNRFCLRFQDAGALTWEVESMFRIIRENNLAHAIANLRQDALKYAAFNLYTLRKYGTLEFRALQGTSDITVVEPWVQAILNLRMLAAAWEEPAALYAKFLEDPRDFADKLFGHAPDKFLLPGWQEQVEEGFSQNQAVLMSL